MAEIEGLADNIIGVALVSDQIAFIYGAESWLRPPTEDEYQAFENSLSGDITSLITDESGQGYSVMTFLNHPDVPASLARDVREKERISEMPPIADTTDGDFLADYTTSVSNYDELTPNADSLPRRTRVPPTSNDHSKAVTSDKPMTFLTGTSHNHVIDIPFESKQPHVASVCVSADGRTAITGHFDRLIRLWDLSDGRLLRIFEGHQSSVDAVELSADGKLIISGTALGEIFIWDCATAQRLCSFETTDGCRINSVSMTSDASLALSNRDMNDVMGHRPLILWNTNTGRSILTMSEAPGMLGAVNAARISPDGGYAVSASQEGAVRRWDTATGEVSGEFGVHDADAYAVCISADSRFVASGGDDHLVKVWDAGSQECIATLSGHTGCVMSVTLARDGQVALSSGSDNTARVWNVQTGDCLAVLDGHSQRVYSHMSPDGRTVVCGSRDNKISVWSLDWKP